jgi:hypothetical protein
MKGSWQALAALFVAASLALAGCGEPELDPNYVDPAADPSALPDMPADINPDEMPGA